MQFTLAKCGVTVYRVDSRDVNPGGNIRNSVRLSLNYFAVVYCNFNAELSSITKGLLTHDTYFNIFTMSKTKPACTQSRYLIQSLLSPKRTFHEYKEKCR